MTQVWLITGSGSGLGRHIAEAALAAGHWVLATAREVRALDALVERYGPRVRTAALDVRDEAQGVAAVRAAVAAFGRLDVLVNNAGYGDARPFEQIPSEDFRAVVETCLFGVVNLSRAALPLMRAQRSGHIIQISSVGGRITRPGNSSYFAAKWAVGGFTECLAQEAAPFGVAVTALEPGGMQTNWGKRAHGQGVALLPDYEPSVGAFNRMLEDYWGHENGDPAKVAQVVLKLAAAAQLPPHILLGSDAFAYARQAEQERAELADRWQALSVSIDRAASGPVPELAGLAGLADPGPT